MLAVLAVATSAAFAASVPITPSQEGLQNVQATGFPNEICPADVASLGCGGAFQETIGSVNNATIWCVDSQLDVTQSESYIANVESLATPAATFDNSNTVRYGGIDSSGSGGWIYSLSGYTLPSADPANDALTRYELAAILISQYVPSDGDPLNNTENQSIQDAIWHLTENGSVGTQADLTGAINVDVPAGYSDWIAYAAAILNANPNYAWNQWAVVSGGYGGGGCSSTLVSTPGDTPAQLGCTLAAGTPVQTFLVQVNGTGGGFQSPTPEPRFYGVLLVGMLGLYGMASRLRRHRSVTPAPTLSA